MSGADKTRLDAVAFDACIRAHGLEIPPEQRQRVFDGAQWLAQAVALLRGVQQSAASLPDKAG